MIGNVQVYVITSSASSTPLAEIRTDGAKVEFLVDNTEGKLSQMVGNSFMRLKQIVEKSSHLKLEQPSEPVAHLLRYVMSNGDIVEITTDGKTVLLNGDLLNEDEKSAFFEALKGGEITVAHKADVGKPIPVMPKINQSSQAIKVEMPEPGKINPELMRGLNDQAAKNQQNLQSGNQNYDKNIEKADTSATDDPEFFKYLAYNLKYGSYRGKNG